MAERRGKKTNHNKNFVAHKEWMEGKKLGRRKQVWVWHQEYEVFNAGGSEKCGGHWEKI
jgi:hypothetical protein